MTDDRRAVLGAIAFGDDPRITPSERIRALELLDELPGAGEASSAFRRARAERSAA